VFGSLQGGQLEGAASDDEFESAMPSPKLNSPPSSPAYTSDDDLGDQPLKKNNAVAKSSPAKGEILKGPAISDQSYMNDD
jgi:hypothetical protein